MGLFSKTVCNICGASVSLGSKPLIDGYICSKCRSKCSPHLNYYSNMTADEVREHIKLRERNLANLKQFYPTKILLAATSEDEEVYGGQIYIDEKRRQFLISEDKNYIAKNIDLFDYSDFRSFTYSSEDECFIITLMIYSKACNTIVEQEFEWDVCIPDRFSRRPKESPEYKSALSRIQEIEKFFNSMADDSISPTESSSVNIRCPNCGAMTSITGRTGDCRFCGATIVNPLFQSEEKQNTNAPSKSDEKTEKDNKPRDTVKFTLHMIGPYKPVKFKYHIVRLSDLQIIDEASAYAVSTDNKIIYNLTPGKYEVKIDRYTRTVNVGDSNDVEFIFDCSQHFNSIEITGDIKG